MAKYYFDPTISYKTFKKVNDALYAGSGSYIKPMHINKVLWHLLKDRKLNIGINTDKKYDPMFFSLKEIPKNSKMINNP